MDLAQPYPDKLVAKWAEVLHQELDFDATLGFPGEGWLRAPSNMLASMLILVGLVLAVGAVAAATAHGSARQGPRDLLATRVVAPFRLVRDQGLEMSIAYLQDFDAPLCLVAADEEGARLRLVFWVQHCFD